jgi:hypothetical protein
MRGLQLGQLQEYKIYKIFFQREINFLYTLVVQRRDHPPVFNRLYILATIEDISWI